MNNIKAHHLKKLQAGIITAIEAGELQLKLIEMGFMDGQLIKLLHKSIGGKTLCFEVGNAYIGLRKKEAALISVLIQE